MIQKSLAKFSQARNSIGNMSSLFITAVLLYFVLLERTKETESLLLVLLAKFGIILLGNISIHYYIMLFFLVIAYSLPTAALRCHQLYNKIQAIIIMAYSLYV